MGDAPVVEKPSGRTILDVSTSFITKLSSSLARTKMESLEDVTDPKNTEILQFFGDLKKGDIDLKSIGCSDAVIKFVSVWCK